MSLYDQINKMSPRRQTRAAPQGTAGANPIQTPVAPVRRTAATDDIDPVPRIAPPLGATGPTPPTRVTLPVTPVRVPTVRADQNAIPINSPSKPTPFPLNATNGISNAPRTESTPGVIKPGSFADLVHQSDGWFGAPACAGPQCNPLYKKLPAPYWTPKAQTVRSPRKTRSRAMIEAQMRGRADAFLLAQTARYGRRPL